jgi:hypothetical protein
MHNIPYLFFDAVANNKLYYDHTIPYIASTTDDKIHLDFNKTKISFLLDFRDKTFANKIFDKTYINFDNKTIFEWISKPGNQKYEEGNTGHTNELGANYISDMIIKEYDKLYN